MQPAETASTTWVGRPRLGWLRIAAVAIVQAASVFLQVTGLQHTGEPPSYPPDAEVCIQVGFFLQIVAMLLLLVFLLRKVRISVSANNLRIGDRRIGLAEATVSVAVESRWRRTSVRLRIRGPGQEFVLRARGAPRRARVDTVSVATPTKIDASLNPLDFEELLAALKPAAVAPLPNGVRFDISPYRGDGRFSITKLMPWLLAIAVLAGAGAILGPLLAATEVGPLILPPATEFTACVGILIAILELQRPPRLLRAMLGPDGLTLVETRSGNVVAQAPLSAIRATRFHYALLGRGDRWNNSGLRLEFPNGFKLALAIPRLPHRWPDQVGRAWAPRWTVELGPVDALLDAVGAVP